MVVKNSGEGKESLKNKVANRSAAKSHKRLIDRACGRCCCCCCARGRHGGLGLLAGRDRHAGEHLKHNEHHSKHEEVDDGKDKVPIVPLGQLRRDDEEHAEEDKEHRLARPREVKRQPHLQTRRHNDLAYHDVDSKDPVVLKS